MGTKIEWTDETLNVVSGCTPRSDGCANCYARGQIERFKGRPGWPKSPDDVTLFPERLEQPFRWKKPRRIFVCSMADLFHDKVPFEYIAAVFGMMAANPQHCFQLLTKRPKRMLEWFQWVSLSRAIDGGFGSDPSLHCAFCLLQSEAANVGFDGPIHCKWGPKPNAPWPLPNVHIGVSVENQETADERIPLLLHTPAVKRFVSCEPLLGSVDLNLATECDRQCAEFQEAHCPGTSGKCIGEVELDQVICGAETGLGKRVMNLPWARYLRDQCKKTNTPFFFKVDSDGNHDLDGKVWEEVPE